jgi:hypothetical protein
MNILLPSSYNVIHLRIRRRLRPLSGKRKYLVTTQEVFVKA